MLSALYYLSHFKNRSYTPVISVMPTIVWTIQCLLSRLRIFRSPIFLIHATDIRIKDKSVAYICHSITDTEYSKNH